MKLLRKLKHNEKVKATDFESCNDNQPHEEIIKWDVRASSNAGRKVLATGQYVPGGNFVFRKLKSK